MIQKMIGTDKPDGDELHREISDEALEAAVLTFPTMGSQTLIFGSYCFACRLDPPHYHSGDAKTFCELSLFVAITLSTLLPAPATPKHHRVTHTHPATNNVVSDPGGCSPVHPPFCSNICTGPGPCAPPDSW